jgi:hypothetical protein
MSVFCTSEENAFCENLKTIISKHNFETAIKKITNLKYPNTNKYISQEHASIYYDVYRKYDTKVSLDKDFDKKAFDKNKKISNKIY